MRNSLSHRRRRLEWSQQELARRSGLSRAAISAIETGRVIPSTAAALSLARAFDCSVEELFSLGEIEGRHIRWAWEPHRPRGRFWQARVGGRTLVFPTEWTLAGSLRHDGIYGEEQLELTRTSDPEKTLVLAGCDPSVGLFSSHVRADCGLRVLPLIRSSREAIRLLGRGCCFQPQLAYPSPSQSPWRVRQFRPQCRRTPCHLGFVSSMIRQGSAR